MPDVLLLAYRTLVGVALVQGDEHRALLVLHSMATLAEARQLPRLKAHGLAERIRIYAMQGCGETAEGLTHALDAMAPTFAEAAYLPFETHYRLLSAIAKAHAAIGRRDLDDAEHRLAEADVLATSMRRARDAMTVKVLRAIVARERDAPNALPLLGEALQLAAIGGYERLLADTHPLAVRMGAELRTQPSGSQRNAGFETSSHDAIVARPVAPSGLLTPKESEILAFLAKGLSNKLIARAMRISDETVKWHIKNVFFKLAAGTRKHAVERARLLGLLAA